MSYKDHTPILPILSLWSRVTEGYGALPAFGLINRLQVGDTGPVESARRSNSRVLGSPFSGLSGQSKLLPATSVDLAERAKFQKKSARARTGRRHPETWRQETNYTRPTAFCQRSRAASASHATNSILPENQAASASHATNSVWKRAEQPALLTQPIASCERTRQLALLTRPKALWSKQAANSAHAAGALLKRPAALNTAGAL